MTAALVVAVVAIAALVAMLWLHRRQLARLEEEVLAVQRTIYKQQKVSVANVERTRRATAKLADECRSVLDTTETLQQRTRELMGDKQIRRHLSHGR